MMASSISPKPTSALHEILKWSVNRPEWQRDALRRIVEKGNLDTTDILELERICRAKLKLDEVKPVPITAKPFMTAHLPPAPGAAESVSLVSIDDLQNVNRLSHGSSLPFGTGTGLAIVFGENGSGKTSYARVIKKACRARGAPPNITPNAFTPFAAVKPATAKITFKVGSTDVSVPWTNGLTADPRLANVFVFDSFSAEHYVSEDSSTAFTPHGLDVLPMLSKVCDALGERLKSDIAQWRNAIHGASANWKYDSTTEVGQCVQQLSATTKEEDIDALAGLDQKQVQQLENLREALKSDPLQKAKETRAAIARLESFAKRIGNAATDLAEEKADKIEKQFEDAKTTESVATAFAAGQFDASFLAGTGSELWRALWDAAREYSNSEAYPDNTFPVISDDARCVLCQRKYDNETVKVVSRFDIFCKDTSQRLSEKAEQALLATQGKLNLINQLTPELEKVEADLAGLTDEQRLLLLGFTTKSDDRLQQVKKCLIDRDWVVSTSIPASTESIVRTVMTNLEARAKTEESAHDPVIRKNLEEELRELAAREWLVGTKADVIEQINRYKAIADLETNAKDIHTGSITAKSTELTKQFVTDAFQQCFKDELKILGLRTLDVVLKPVQGKKGTTKFGLRLVEAGNSKVVDIASEGEQRCIALAAFLSELSQASHQSALVFDDPVSSLDHWHREKIANRLVLEANNRQVIVFTHDVIFMNDLLAFSERATMQPNVLTLEWNDGAPGKYIQGLPWDSRKPNACLDELEINQKDIKSKWNPQPNTKNIAAMRNAYSRLRSTMERVIEVELLDGIVCRFESQVNAGRVKSLIGITPAECNEAKRLLKKCHTITDAHAPSTAAIPEPNELAQDIADARQLIQKIRCRKKQVQGNAP